MVIIAISLYLPEHITTIVTRAWFYYAGDDRSGVRGATGATNLAARGQGVKGSGNGAAGWRSQNQEVMDMLAAL